MAANKKNNNTSKTAHVMNLLSRNQVHAPPSLEVPGDGQAIQKPTENRLADPPPSTPVSPIIASLTPDSTVSNQIKSALENALAEELEAQNNHQASMIKPAPTLTPEPAFLSGPTQTPTPIPSPQPSPRPSPISGDETETAYVNVTEILVEERAKKYIELSGICQCPKCLAAVKAIALNNLPPKYVEVSPNGAIPLISFYESQLNHIITTQLFKACELVMAHPGHSQPQ